MNMPSPTARATDPAGTVAQARQVLIVCSHFWPSIGGLETSMGQLGSELVRAGYAVTVMTLFHPGRTADTIDGIRIAGIASEQFSAAIREAVASGRFDAAILVQDPLGHIIWSVEGLTPPAHTRLLIQPIINEDGYSRWKDNHDFVARLTQRLQHDALALVMTKSGPDSRFMHAAHIDHVYLPNASSQIAPAGDFRRQFGIAPERFVILHVANLYWVKNHVGLIDALPDMPASWQLVMIGNPTGSADCVEAVRARLAARPEILFIPGLPPEWVSAAMEAADVVVLASHGEGSPITLLEAMSHSKPWLATPQCGAANDHLGGIICDLPDFKANLAVLATHTALRQEFGRISHAHWRACYSWPVVLRGWTDLIEHGRLQRSFEPDRTLTDAMQTAMQQCRAARQAGAPTPAPAALVSVIVLVRAHCAALPERLQALRAQRHAAIEIIVVNDGPEHAESFLSFDQAPGPLRYLAIGPQRSRAAARNAGVRLASGKFITFVGEDDTLRPGHIEALAGALQQGPQRLAYGRAEYLLGTERRQPFADLAFSRDLLMISNFIPGPTWLCEKALFDDAGPFDEGLEQQEDWEWLIRAAGHGAFRALDQVTAEVRHGAPDAADARFWHEAVYAMHPSPALQNFRDEHMKRQFGAAPDPAEAALLAGAASGSLDVRALIDAAERHVSAGAAVQAVRLYRLWLRSSTSPLRFAIAFNLGTILETAGRFDEAGQAYREAVACKSDFAPARFRLAAQCVRRADVAGASAQWEWLAAPGNAVEASHPELFRAALENRARFMARPGATS